MGLLDFFKKDKPEKPTKPIKEVEEALLVYIGPANGNYLIGNHYLLRLCKKSGRCTIINELGDIQEWNIEKVFECFTTPSIYAKIRILIKWKN